MFSFLLKQHITVMKNIESKLYSFSYMTFVCVIASIYK